MASPDVVIQNIPEQGQIVTIRRRKYVVTDIQEAHLSQNVVRNRLSRSHHLITLSSIEDDGLGEMLHVVWEIEPGAVVTEKVLLPVVRNLDSPQRLDTFLDAVRWGAVSQADTRVLQAPFRSGIEIEDYQLNPLARAIQMPRVSLLIADDVGLGKTIEAGLVMQELLVRNRVRTVLIVCPAGLQIHWRDQMRDKFGLEFRIVDSDLMKSLRRTRGIRTNPWSHFPRLITSIDYIKRERPMRMIRDVLPAEGESRYPRRFDMLIVDEAHNVAPSGGGKYAVDSMRTQAIRALVPHFEHKIFLSATPHNGYQESFTALLELLDNQRFARGVMPDKDQLATVMVRRLKREIKRWDGEDRFPKRKLKTIEVDYSDEERQIHQMLRRYTRLRIKNSTSRSEEYATEFVLKLLKKRLFSSPQAFLDTLNTHEATLKGQTDSATTRKTPVREGILRRQIAQIDEDYADDEEYETAADDVLESATRLFRPLTDDEQHLIDEMRHWAEIATGQRDDKTKALIEWLRSVVKPDGVWNNERVILFTEYRATQKWLQTILATEGFSGDERLMTIYGGMDSDSREQIKAAFQAHPDVSDVRILLATDAASEGIDLQNYCHRLVHIEIPWNPNRMEQRNGRIDRHGQRHNPLIYHFVSAGYEERAQKPWLEDTQDLEADLEFLMRAARKVEQIREDLGNVGPVIAKSVEQAMLGGNKSLDTSKAETRTQRVERMLKIERDLQKQVTEHLAQLDETRDTLNLSGDAIQQVVETALSLAGQPPLRPDKERDNAYVMPPLQGSWAKASEGLQHPHSGEIRPIVFDHALAKQYGDQVVLAHLNHRLVQMSLRLLRAEIWSAESEIGLNRVTARQVPNTAFDDNAPAVIAHARLVVVGGDSHLLHEEIIAAGGILKPIFNRMNVGQVEKALAAQTDYDVAPGVEESLINFWHENGIEENLMLALEARQKAYFNRMETLLEERAETEKQNIEAVLTELARSIADELDEPEMKQLDLPGFNADDRERHKSALEARLAQIPEEIEQEKAAIERRFANPETRLFPVSVTFLVPERLNR